MNLDPRIKIIIAAILSTLSVLVPDIIMLIMVLVLSVILGLLLKADYKKFILRARYLLVILISLTIIQSVFLREGTPLLSINNYAIITDKGLMMGLKFILRMLIIVSSAIIISTSDSKEITDGLVMLKLPYELAFMMNIAVRFLPDMRQEFSDRMLALKLRGVNIRKLPLNKRIKAYVYLFTPAIANTILKSRSLSVAMQARGFRAYNRRTMYRELKLKALDYYVLSAFITAIITMLVLGGLI